MNWLKTALILSTCALPAGCYGGMTEGDEAVEVGETEQAVDVTKTGSLIKKQGGLASIFNEIDRQADTALYYDSVLIGADGGSGTDIKNGLPNLQAFRNFYGFAGQEVVTYYYNRGDLGIGREMHCVDKLLSTGEIACYVSNFAAGDDGSEFTFGMSPNIAYKNQDANHPFATVAMVYRDQAVSGAPAGNRVYFVVFGANGNRQNLAALDRTGILFATGQNTTSVPGVNFNNHIPSNCATCHGGSYNNAGKFLPGALFLPFDLDQFEYQNTPGRSRVEQLTAFKRMNEMVWKVAYRNAVLSGTDPNQHPVKKQLDGWYGNTVFQANPKSEVFEGNFNSGFTPGCWTQFSGIYQSVVRPMCRGCHITNSLPFDTELQFKTFATDAVNDLCSYQMPHALQTVREFWLSTKPAELEIYLRGVGKTTEANTLHNCGPGNVATLDPQHIMAAWALQPFHPWP